MQRENVVWDARALASILFIQYVVESLGTYLPASQAAICPCNIWENDVQILYCQDQPSSIGCAPFFEVADSLQKSHDEAVIKSDKLAKEVKVDASSLTGLS